MTGGIGYSCPPDALANPSGSPPSWGTMYPDATRDFLAALNDPRRWIVKPGVPVFKPHQRVDPNTGKLIVVDVPKLYRIAANSQRLERLRGVPSRTTIGHTEPTLPETLQPPVAGFYRNYRVGRFGPSGEIGIIADEWLDPRYGGDRKNYPFRSAEYYDDAEEIRGVALLTRDPYLDLGVVAYSRSVPGAVHYSRSGERPLTYHFLLRDAMFPTFPAAAPLQNFTHALPAHLSPYPQPVYGAQYPNGMPMGGFAGHTHAVPYGAPQFGGSQFPQTPPGWSPQQQSPAHYGPWQVGQMGGRPNGGMPTGYDDMGGMQPGMPQAAPAQAQAPVGYCPTCFSLISDHVREHAPQQQQPSQSPFPGDANGGNNPIQNSMRGMPPRHGEAYPYASSYVPTQYGAQPLRTLTGLPVGYQMELDRMRMELQNTQRAMQVIMYEREQADTAACVADIRRLHSMGYPVSEYEVRELKSKATPQERDAYISAITTRYQRVPTEHLPPINPGYDPTPGGYDPNANRPATQQEVELALQLNKANPQLTYPQALAYARSGAAGSPTPYGAPGMVPGMAPPQMGAPMMPGNPLQAYAFPPGGAAPGVGGGMPNMGGGGGGFNLGMIGGAPQGGNPFGPPTLPNGQPFMEPYPGSEPMGPQPGMGL
jgi:hypothetical protein